MAERYQALLVDNAARGRYFQNRINTTDGVFDVFVDGSRLHRTELAHVLDVLGEVDSITGVPINVAYAQTDNTDLVVGHTPRGQLYDAGLEDYDSAQGLAWLHSDGDAHSSWRDDGNVTSFKKKRNKKGKVKFDEDGNPKYRETLTGYGKYVITHEILHNFGLKHPNDNGLDPSFTQKDTVMSYRWDGTYHGIGTLDHQALQYLWGADPGVV